MAAPDREQRQQRPGRVAIALAVVLVAINLRPALASVGPVLAEIRHGLGLSSTTAALLTALPVVCFGVLAPAAPRLARRYGMEPVLTVTMGIVATGLLLRVAGGTAILLLGTIVVAAAIAVANVLVPALVKRDFPDRAGSMMGVYVMALSVAASVAAGLSVPAAEATGRGWRAALAIWAVPAVLAVLVWLPRLRGTARAAAPAVAATPATSWRVLLRDRVAWQVTAFMGLQSLLFYAVLAWLPTVYIDHGYRPEGAGLLLSLVTLLNAPASLIAPALATRAAHQGGLIVISAGLSAAGVLGVLVSPLHGEYLWAILLGSGEGASFALALTLVVLRSRNSHAAAQLSAMAQSCGYLIAAAGPLVVGLVRELTGGWTAPLALLLVLLVLQLVVGVAAGRPRFAADDAAGTATPARTDPMISRSS